MTTLQPLRPPRGEQLAAMLREQGASPAEIADLTPALLCFAAWEAPTPTVADMDRLVTHLVKHGEPFAPTPSAVGTSQTLRQRWAIFWRQRRLIHRSVWWSAAIAIMLATANMLMRGRYDTSSLTVFLPVIAAISVAFLYGPEVDPCLELTLTMPTTPRLMLLSRLALLLGCELALGLVATGIVALSRGQGIDVLATIWIVPMALLAVVSMLLSLLLGPIIATTTTLALWFAQFINLGSGITFSQTVSPFWRNDPVLLLLSVACLLLTLLSVPRCERIASRC